MFSNSVVKKHAIALLQNPITAKLLYGNLHKNLAAIDSASGFLLLDDPSGTAYLVSAMSRANDSSPYIVQDHTTIAQNHMRASELDRVPITIFYSAAVTAGKNQHPEIWGAIQPNTLPVQQTMLGGERVFVDLFGNLHICVRDISDKNEAYQDSQKLLDSKIMKQLP